MDAHRISGRAPSLPKTLEPYRCAIEASVRPALALSTGERQGVLSGSRYRGAPLVPPGTPWPRSPNGPMSFLGQLNFADLSRASGGGLPGLPRQGILGLFYDAREQRWGFDPRDQRYWRVTFVRSTEGAVALVPPSEARSPYLGRVLHAKPTPSLPAPGDVHQVRFPLAFQHALGRDYRLAHAQHLRVWSAEHQVMGHAHWLAGDARLLTQKVTLGSYCGGMTVGGDCR